jgi:hypothetical protein
MRIVYEWDKMMGSCMLHQVSVAEGETIAEINAEICREAGEADVRIVGLRNTRGNFEIYTGREYAAGEYPHGFADSPPAPRPKSWFRRGLDRVRGFWQS